MKTNLAKKNLSFRALVKDAEAAIKKDQFKRKVNMPPPRHWIKRNPYANNCEYLPIDKTELLLDMICQDWQIELLSTGQFLNAAKVEVRVHYFNPITNQWRYHDGVGVEELQTEAGSGILKPDFSNLKPGASKKAMPSAKSMAIKDACDHIGKIFGRDLNRKDPVDFVPIYDVDIPLETLQKGIAEK